LGGYSARQYRIGLYEVIAMTLSPRVKKSLLGMGIGAGIGMVPGLFSALVTLINLSFLNFLRADVGIMNASALLVYLGLLIGGAAGAIIATVGTGAGTGVDVVPMAEEVRR
jgi:hypothetical protein